MDDVCPQTSCRFSPKNPYYPQSNGKLERWHATLKGERFRQTCPDTLCAARRVVAEFVAHYNQVRLHSALGYITPHDKLAGLAEVIFVERDRKLEAARQRRRSAARVPFISPTGESCCVGVGWQLKIPSLPNQTAPLY